MDTKSTGDGCEVMSNIDITLMQTTCLLPDLKTLRYLDVIRTRHRRLSLNLSRIAYTRAHFGQCFLIPTTKDVRPVSFRAS